MDTIATLSVHWKCILLYNSLLLVQFVVFSCFYSFWFFQRSKMVCCQNVLFAMCLLNLPCTEPSEPLYMSVCEHWCLLGLCDHLPLARSVFCNETNPQRQSSDLFFHSESWNTSPGHLNLTKNLEISWEHHFAWWNVQNNEIWMLALTGGETPCCGARWEMCLCL